MTLLEYSEAADYCLDQARQAEARRQHLLAWFWLHNYRELRDEFERNSINRKSNDQS
jgi:hypothetical protein